MAKPKPAAVKAPKLVPAPKVRSKGDVYGTIAAHTGLARKQVAGVFDTMSEIIKADLAKGCGMFAVPGMMKITVIKKPATKGGMRPNPFKPGEMMEVKPKPARKVVKVRALRALKAMV
ncbi:MAG: HU family DNA-binding protein [Phycisphaeraceae bacterium]|nr:HU family DNA-binding protein [Phycisphaeraceae bacterium]